MSSHIQPPKYFKRFLKWYCKPSLLEELEGDIEESFYKNYEEYSLSYAKKTYRKEVLSLFRPSVIKNSNFNHLVSNYMLENYFKITVRSLWKNKLYACINIVGMGVALACCIVAYLNFKFYTTYDEHHENINSIYRVNAKQTSQEGRPLDMAISPLPIGQSIENVQGVEEVIRYTRKTGSVKAGSDLFQFPLGFTDDNFVDVFTLPLLYGNPKSLADKSKILISENMSKTLFGEANSIGNTVTFFDQGEEKSYTVSGVYKKRPLNSSFSFEALTNIENLFDIYRYQPSDWGQNTTTFLQISDAQNISTIEKQLNKYIVNQNQAREDFQVENYYLDPFKGMAARAEVNNIYGPLNEALPWPIFAVPAVIALLILMIASFTFTNTALASYSTRLKEIGVRKVLGSQKRQIVMQFLGETVIVCLLSLIIAFPVADFLSAEYSQLIPKIKVELVVTDNLAFILFLVGLVILTGVFAGSYPALYISRFKPKKILTGELKYGKIGKLSKVLLTVQFCFSMLAIMASILFIQNAKFQEATDLGFDTDQTVVIRLPEGASQFKPLEDILSQNSKVKTIIGAEDHVGRRFHTEQVATQHHNFEVASMNVGENYIPTMELEIVEGRDFKLAQESDFEEAVIVNESFVKKMGWEKPLEQKLIFNDSLPKYVVGVVKDFYFDSFESAIQPLALKLIKPEGYRYLIAKTETQHVSQLLEESKVAWRDSFRNNKFDIKSGEHAKWSALYMNKMIVKIFLFMGGIATILSLIGLFSLISLNIVRRTKEIGIRKSLGASITDIITIINKQYFILLGIGILIGASLSYMLIPMFMSAVWSHHVDASILIYLFAIGLMLLMCTMTVGVKLFKAASVSPVKLLRDE